MEKENFEKKTQPFDEFYSTLIPLCGRVSVNADEFNTKDKYVKLFATELGGPGGGLPAQRGHVNESTHFEMVANLKTAGFSDFATILPIPKLKYLLFNKLITGTEWVEKLEKTPWLLAAIKLFKFRGVGLLSFPVSLIATT